MSTLITKATRYVEKNPEVPAGAAIGAAAGLGESACQVAIGCIQLAFYPLYMANAAVRPVVRIVSPTVIMPLYTTLGALGGAAYKVAKETIR